jgi:manganese oxidase
MFSLRSPISRVVLGGLMAALLITLVGVLLTRSTADARVHTTRTYFIAADEVGWDYAPSGHNLVTGLPFGDEENVFVQNVPARAGTPMSARVGSQYRKALYREYTDATFTHLKPRPARWQHLGALGPVIQAEVGDTIVVTFKNNASRPYDVHPHGVFYNKDSEGAPYDDGGPNHGVNGGDVVEPGHTWIYTWQVPQRAGPGPSDGSSAFWMYHSHVDEVRDTNSGLLGPMIIYGEGLSRPDGQGGLIATDLDAEFVNLFTVENENESWYIEDNIRAYTGLTNSQTIARLEADEDFVESNLMHSVNGYVYGNLPLDALTMHRNDRVRWYVFSLGTEVDLHTPHWHGQSLLAMGMRTDVTELLPGSMRVLDMQPDNPGIWLYHCHVNDHIRAGMILRYRVLP